MGFRWTMLGLALLVAFSACYGLAARGDDDDQERLDVAGPKEIFRSDGGVVEVWSSSFRVLQDANIDTTRVTIENRGLALFQYAEAPQLLYVLEGEAKVGVSYPWEQSEHVRNVKQGEVIAIPQGVGHWWYNGAQNRFVVLSVADTTNAVIRGEHDNFYLHGGSKSAKDLGSVLRGFDGQLLSEALDVDIQVVNKIRESQKGTVIVKLNSDLNVPESTKRSDSEEVWENFTYNIDEEQPDIRVENGGSFNLLTRKTLPILKEVGLTAIRVRLEPEALFAPSYILNAHTAIYVTKGNGRIQVIGSEELLLDANVKEGSLVVVPQAHPDIKKAGNDGLEFIAITTSHAPVFSFLAGKNALYRNIPVEVLAAGDNVSTDLEQQIRNRRQNDAVIFPPRGKSGSFSTGAIKKLNSLFLDEEVKEVFKKAYIQL